MDLVEKIEPIIIFFAIILGLLLSNVSIIAQNTGNMITLFLCLMLFGLFLEIPLNELKNSFKNVKFSLTSLIINFLWTPLFGYFLGTLFLKGNVDILVGFFMLILTPCTDWYLVFTKLAKGDLTLSLSILPINLILQIVLLLFCIFASQGELLYSNLESIVKIFIPLIIFFTANAIIDLLLSEKINFTYPEYASLTMTTLARNSPLALAIAINSFPGHELIAMALVIGPLIELPILYIVSRFCLWIKNSGLFFVCGNF